MGQGEIIDVLKREGHRLTAKEIANKCNVGTSCTIVKLRKLRENGDVERIKEGVKYFYKLKS